MFYRDRRDGGRELAERLAERESLGPDPIVLALPRGGVPVGFEVAKRLGLPLDVLVVRKLGVPGHEELAMGAIASDGTVVLNHDVIQSLRIPEALVRRTIDQKKRELEQQTYRARPPPRLGGRSVILVDDGLATGSTMLAAIAAVRRQDPARVVVAVPLSSYQACREIGEKVDLMVCGGTPEPFYGVGAWYEDFSQTTDDEVRALLRAAEEGAAEARP